jgi:hypothetical protein
MSVGTGGTIAGVGTFIKSMKEDVIVALADPEGSGLYNRVGLPFPGTSMCIHTPGLNHCPRSNTGCCTIGRKARAPNDGIKLTLLWKGCKSVYSLPVYP